ncbi:uncharacterized protein LOC128209687 [Mya arenaria]|uniref:uncharacterized protein LOC128209687 n=1 Tax=Mya arenaria TaxID=6604 RepID=UPI0022E0F9AD|nr:uncharacterized protein LOC128209687 [Mya arenaria]XP_052769805.1 uncharacterized protein LOC128209687 [Mya arenaria]
MPSLMQIMSLICAMARKSIPQKIFKLMLFTVLAVLLYSLTANITQKTHEDKLGPAFTLISNLDSHLDDLKSFDDVADEQKISLMDRLRNGINSLMKNCRDSDEHRKNCDEKYKSTQKKILTIFTTFVYEKEKFPINNKTLHNWKMLPNVNVVVFSDSEEVKYVCNKVGVHVLKVTDAATGVPVLPSMFLDAKKQFSSTFYAYANGDLLFSDNLINTLKTISCNLPTLYQKTKGLLIVGRRRNIPATVITDHSAISWSELYFLSKKYEKLFQTDAEDYFISDEAYPWENFQPVVVGRRGYDNWVVAYSRYLNITVIDASESVLCLHQTLATRGNYEGLHKGDYNLDLLYKQDVPFYFGDWGRTFCSMYKTWHDLCGNLVISRRKKIEKMCFDFKWKSQLSQLLFGGN